MRLWHKDLIPYLPRQQLVSQWRECCCIARNIHENGTPNHILVNKILCYSPEDFNSYAGMVIAEMNKRGYSIDPERFWRWRDNKHFFGGDILFKGWHNRRYLEQCLMNLEEKYDCGGITNDEWAIIVEEFGRYFPPSRR